jgi:hypothetical protein
VSSARAVVPILGLLAFGVASLGSASDIEVRTELSPEVIGIEQLATLTIEIEGTGLGRLRPEPEFGLDNLRIVAGPYSQESLQFVNGTTSRSARISWRLRPLEVGPARVHSIVLRIGDRIVEQADLHLTVRRESVEVEEPEESTDPFDNLFEPFRRPRSRPSQRGRSEVFLRAVAAPADPFVGQQVLYTLYLYTQSDISSINPESLPDFQGFWVHEIPQPKQFQPEMVEVDGKTFARVKLLERAIFPLRDGEFELQPTRALMAVKVPVTTMRLSLLSQTEEIQRVSNAVTVNVRPLPASPPDFTGAVGDLELEARLEPESVEAGEAATLHVVLSGRGLLQGLPDPELPPLPQIEVYPPQESSADAIRSGQVEGERTWSYVLVPDRPGSIEIPPMKLPFFDPELGRFRLAASEPLSLQVLPSTRTTVTTAVIRKLHPIRSAALPVTGAPATWKRVLPHALLASAVLGLVVTWGVRHLDRFTPDHRQAVHQLASHLSHARKVQRPRQAAAELEEAWRVYLHDRWDIAPGTPSTHWQSALEEHGANPKASAELARLSEDLHYLRYAPKLSSTDALQRELIQRSRQILKALH